MLVKFVKNDSNDFSFLNILLENQNKKMKASFRQLDFFYPIVCPVFLLINTGLTNFIDRLSV